MQRQGRRMQRRADHRPPVHPRPEPVEQPK
jgi:hypothetical protein